MDDELKAIQDDLDGVLQRLAEYMSRDDGGEQKPCAPEEAASVAWHYSTTVGHTIRDSIDTLKAPRAGLDEYTGLRLGENPDKEESQELADLMEAMRALVEWQITRRPLEDKHMWSLYEAVCSWSAMESQFLGESAGLTLTPRRQIDRRLTARRNAVAYAYALHQRDPEAFPMDESLFEMAGAPFGMSARTVSRAYYSEDGQFGRELFEQMLGDTSLAEQIFDEMSGDPYGRQVLKLLAASPGSWEAFPDVPRLRLAPSEIEALFEPVGLSGTSET